MPLKDPKNIADVVMDVQIIAGAVGADLVDPDEVGGRLGCSIIRLLPNIAFPRHTHPPDHLLLIIEGDGYLLYWEDETEHRINFGAGDVFPVPKGVLHEKPHW